MPTPDEQPCPTSNSAADDIGIAIMGSSRDCIVVLDLEGHTLEVSPGGVESMEVSDVSAILGLSWLRVWSGADHAAATAAVAAARAGGVGRFQGYCPTHKGNARWWDVAISPLPGPDGKPQRLLSVGRDITHQTLAQVEFQALAQALPNHVWTARPDGLLDWFNERVYAYSGAAAGALDGQGWASIVHPDDLEMAANRWAASLTSEQPYEAEFRLRRHDGIYRWHIARAAPVRSPVGSLLRWVGTNTDIEEERAVRMSLAELNESLEEQRDRMWEASPDLMLVIDFGGVFRRVNPAWTKVLGYTPGELIGHHVNEFVMADDHPDTVSAYELAAAGGQPRLENRYRHKDGSTRWISWVAAPAGNVTYATGRDITAEKLREAELVLAQESLRQAQKMEAVGQLTGGVSHDFNNILQVISGNLHLLKRFAIGDERMEIRISSAQEAVKRGARLASQLLAFSRRQPLAPLALNAGRLIAAMEDMLRRALGEAIELEFVVSGGLWSIFADPTQIENAVLNLAINARDAMSGRGKLTIEISNAWLDERYAMEHAEVAAGQYVLIAVSDTGTGMPPEVAEKAFEPFFTTKPVGTGTGLGLSMIYGFVKQSGGHVKIYSELGQGTTMKLYLPRSHLQPSTSNRAEEHDVQGGHETILVAEDDEGVRVTVVAMLRELGYRVLEACDADSALNIVESGVPIDLLFTDVVMPGTLKSVELARLAKLRLPGLAVLFTSGYTQNAIVHGGRLDPGVELIGKPYAHNDLALRLRHMLSPKR